jgi:hypothetical protein
VAKVANRPRMTDKPTAQRPDDRGQSDGGQRFADGAGVFFCGPFEPVARPNASASRTSASRASRAATRNTRAVHAPARRIAICQVFVAGAIATDGTAVAVQPPCREGAALFRSSARAPPPKRATPASASLTLRWRLLALKREHRGSM